MAFIYIGNLILQGLKWKAIYLFPIQAITTITKLLALPKRQQNYKVHSPISVPQGGCFYYYLLIESISPSL